MRPDRTFRSRVDLWLVVVVAGAAALPLLTGLWLAAHGEKRGGMLLIGWGVIISTMVGALSVPLRYTFRADHLHIRSGWLHWEVPYAGLRRACRTSNPLSGPAWSLRRVKLEYSGSFILVSPDDRESFMEELSARCPHLACTVAGLVPPPRPP